MVLIRNLFLFATAFLAFPAHAQESVPANRGVIGDVQSPGATVRGSVIVDSKGASVMSGSQIAAGDANAAVKLRRGGELQVCKQSSITLTSSSNGREMLVALNSGAIEAHYTLPSTSDTVMTPDFRLTLTGPGEFHFAIGASASGGLCVRSLAGNSSSLIVNEQFGDGAHQVKPGEQIMFRNGHVDDSAAEAAECGCPRPPVAEKPVAPVGLNFPEQQSREAEQAVSAGLKPREGAGVPIAASEAVKPGQTITQVDAPMVFRAEEATVPPQPSVAMNRMPPWPVGRAQLPDPVLREKAEKKPWYKRFGSALASIFGGGNPSRKAP